MSIELVMPSNHLLLCCPLLLLPSIFASIRVFSNELALHIRWTKNWSFSISPSNEYSGSPLGWAGWISLQSKGLSRVFFNTTVQKHQFFGAQPSVWSNSHIHTLIQFSSVVQSCLTLCSPLDCSTPGFCVHQQVPELTQTHVHWVSDTIQPSQPLLSPSPAFNLSQHQVFSNESALHISTKSFSFNISPSNEHPGLISFWMDWLDLLAVQGTLKSLLQHHRLKASILRRSAYFTVQLSHPYMTTGKTIALTR